MRLQVQHVILVDPGRHDQQRLLISLYCGGFELQQLQQVVLKHHLARRRGNVAAQCKRLPVRHADTKLARFAIKVVDKVLQSLEQIVSF